MYGSDLLNTYRQDSFLVQKKAEALSSKLSKKKKGTKSAGVQFRTIIKGEERVQRAVIKKGKWSVPNFQETKK